MRISTEMASRFLLVSFVICLAQMVVLFTITVVWRIRRTENFRAEEQIICEASSAFKIDGKLPEGCREDQGTKGSRCCFKASQVIDILVNKSAKQLSREFNPRETAAVINLGVCGEVKRTSGKVEGIAYHRLKEETRERDLVYWEKSAESILESVRYTNGRFYISEPGFYYVSSQVMYAHDPESVTENDARQTHSLHRKTVNQGNSEKLLEKSRTFAELHSSQNNGTSFIGAVFKFDQYDAIMIKCTHTHLITGGEQDNFFSLYMI